MRDRPHAGLADLHQLADLPVGLVARARSRGSSESRIHEGGGSQEPPPFFVPERTARTRFGPRAASESLARSIREHFPDGLLAPIDGPDYDPAMFGTREAYGLITLLATVVATWFLFGLLRDEPGADRFTVVLLFEDAEGINAGTPVKTHGVTVGEVHRVTLAPGGRGTEVLCSLDDAPGSLPRVASRFWIVRPWFGGIAAGGGGLDTLIKDSYVAYEIGDRSSPALVDGARVPGMRLPPDNPRALLDLPPAPGDLELAVRFPTSGGLTAARPVRFRGIEVGLVTAVELLPDGSGVEVRARIERRFRSLVHTESEFWIDGVDVKAGWSGVQVEGLEAVLQGAALAFHTPDDRTRTPAADGTIFSGELERPEIEWVAPATIPLRRDGEVSVDRGDPILSSLVQVHYSCVERDWFSPNDRYERTSPGVLHRTLDGLPSVLVLARAVDGRLWIDDGGGEPDLSEEAITVSHPGGAVQEAGIAWRAPDAIDLALLRLPSFPDGGPAVSADFLPEGAAPGAVELFVPTEGGGWRRVAATIDGDGAIGGVPPETPDAVIVRDGRPIGFLRGREADDPEGAGLIWVGFDPLPETLRPAPVEGPR